MAVLVALVALVAVLVALVAVLVALVAVLVALVAVLVLHLLGWRIPRYHIHGQQMTKVGS